jgi:hypothetical protein
MEHQDRNIGGADRSGSAGAANTPPFEREPPVVRTAADHQIPSDTGGRGAAGRGGGAESETERELERTRDVIAEAAAPVMAEKTQEAIAETASRLKDDPAVVDQVKRTATAMQHDAQRLAREKLGEVGERVEGRINEGLHAAADRLETAASQLDELADERLSGTGAKARAGDMAHSVADSMESVASYLRDNDLESLQSDLERQVRQRPLQTLFVAVAAGWLAGKILR